MCEFVSGWITESGEIFNASEYTDSHDDLVKIFNLRDTELVYEQLPAAKGACP